MNAPNRAYAMPDYVIEAVKRKADDLTYREGEFLDDHLAIAEVVWRLGFGAGLRTVQKVVAEWITGLDLAGVEGGDRTP